MSPRRGAPRCALLGIAFATAWALSLPAQPPPAPQPIAPRPIEPRAVRAELAPDVAAYRDLRAAPLEGKLDACRRFVARFPGTQLSLRTMREAADLYILQPSGEGANPLEDCGRWMEENLSSPELAWDRYREVSNSVFLDRLETHLVFVRVLASVPRTYSRALEELARVSSELEARPGLLSARPDLEEEMLFTESWCLQGRQDYPSALRSYQQFLERFPSSDFLPAALCYAAICLERTGGDPERAREYRTRLVDEYPASPEAVSVRQTLR